MKKELFILSIICMFILVACAPQYPNLAPKESTKICEKTFNVTKYKEERTPFGTPRCEQMPYNFTKVTYVYSVGVENGKRIGTCTFLMRNDEDIKGTFEFFPNIFKDGKISDGPEISKEIDAFRIAEFEWKFQLDNDVQVGSCMIQCSDCPHRIKCFYLEPITYSVRQIPYTITEKKNVTC